MRAITELAIGTTLTPNGDATQTSLTSNIFDTLSVTTFSTQTTTLGGTITGSVQVQVSNDPVSSFAQVVNWSSPTGAGTYTVAVTGATGAGASLTTSIPDFCWRWARIVYTKSTSAAGALITVAVKTDGF
jgi:hypothetical protein